ncbi:hypothetical protein HJG60_011047 [Phyllostomus discolor]|uniref:Uncharacterized protein n=1 Tax=Phyllostomus discolor TaxID=89673 RepID=A0A834EAG3_9CHIR|nr:hypothetical protein HJG60_011047 [Phyllostomus discolor]
MRSRRGSVKEGAGPACVDAGGAKELEGRPERGKGVIPLGRPVGWSPHSRGKVGPQSSGSTCGSPSRTPGGSEVWGQTARPPPPPNRSARKAPSGHCPLQDSHALVLDVSQLPASVRPRRPEQLWAFCLSCIRCDKAGCPLSLDPSQGHSLRVAMSLAKLAPQSVRRSPGTVCISCIAFPSGFLRPSASGRVKRLSRFPLGTPGLCTVVNFLCF